MDLYLHSLICYHVVVLGKKKKAQGLHFYLKNGTGNEVRKKELRSSNFMLSGPHANVAWHVPRLWTVETASRYGG
jgi:hypothetical protein